MRLLHIGRATTNDIVISDQTVSRVHAQLIVDDLGHATLIDLSSANGTFVNGKRITEQRKLDPSDIVKVGEYLLPWRNYLREEAQSQANIPFSVVAEDIAPVPTETPNEPHKPVPWKLIGIVGAGILLVIVLLIMFTGGSKNPPLNGKWHEKEDSDAWISFGENGKYTEGFKNSVTYDSATWKAMGIERILIEKGNLEISRTYKFEAENLKITGLFR